MIESVTIALSQRLCEVAKNKISRNKKNSYALIKNSEAMKKEIEKLKKGTKLTPKVLKMENSRKNFYRWAEKLDEVIKIDGEYFVA